LLDAQTTIPKTSPRQIHTTKSSLNCERFSERIGSPFGFLESNAEKWGDVNLLCEPARLIRRIQRLSQDVTTGQDATPRCDDRHSVVYLGVGV